MIGSGVLILLFVAFQLWGTGLAESRAQDELKDQFAALQQPTASGTTPTSAPEAPPPAPEGEAIT